jgi:hypothetical protein
MPSCNSYVDYLISVTLSVDAMYCAAAGRWDLHQAITRAGGYRHVGQLLGRRPAWPVPKGTDVDFNGNATAALLSLGEIAEAIASGAAADVGDDGVGGWSVGQMPTVVQLKQAGRQDLLQVREPARRQSILVFRVQGLNV